MCVNVCMRVCKCCVHMLCVSMCILYCINVYAYFIAMCVCMYAKMLCVASVIYQGEGDTQVGLYSLRREILDDGGVTL